jgi:hypothetical protein
LYTVITELYLQGTPVWRNEGISAWDNRNRTEGHLFLSIQCTTEIHIYREDKSTGN